MLRGLDLVDVARYAAIIQAKPITNCDAYLAKSIFKHALGFEIVY